MYNNNKSGNEIVKYYSRGQLFLTKKKKKPLEIVVYILTMGREFPVQSIIKLFFYRYIECSIPLLLTIDDIGGHDCCKTSIIYNT